jgi:hypothetical protein
VPRPLASSNVTSAVLFRAVEKWTPTLIIDEADTFLSENEELRGILNSGHNRRNAYILRAVGEDFEPKQFSTYSPKAIAKIGQMSPTLYSRSIRIELQRKTAEETVEPLRADRLEHLKPLLRMAARWADMDALKACDPEMHSTLRGRLADNWRPLFAIAELVGGKWPDRVRRITTSLVSKVSDDTRAILLLGDIEEIFSRRGIDQIHSDDLVAELAAMEDRPWAEWGRSQKPITKNQLAAPLKPFDVVPGQVWAGGKNKRGYERKALDGLFTRYLPSRGFQSARPLEALPHKELPGIQGARPPSPSDRPLALQKDRNSLHTKGSSTLAPQNPQSGGESDNDPFAGLKDASLALSIDGDDELAIPPEPDRRRR